MDAPGQLAQLREGGVQLSARVAEHRQELRVRHRGPIPGDLQSQGKRDQSLLGAVVEIPLDTPPLGVGGFHEPGTQVPDLVELRSNLGMQALVLEAQAGDCTRSSDERRILGRATSWTTKAIGTPCSSSICVTDDPVPIAGSLALGTLAVDELGTARERAGGAMGRRAAVVGGPRAAVRERPDPARAADPRWRPGRSTGERCR